MQTIDLREDPNWIRDWLDRITTKQQLLAALAEQGTTLDEFKQTYTFELRSKDHPVLRKLR